MPSDIFRQEAIDYHSAARSEGQVLLMLPGWTKWTYRLLLGLLVAGVAFLIFGSVSQYAEGPAVIRAEERVVVSAALPGLVSSIGVTPGMRVARGDLLVSFHATDEEAQSAAVQREFDSALVRMLTNPLDQSARLTLAGLRAQKELLAARFNERLVRAPEAGTVGDVHVKPGQSVAPGELIMSLAREHARFSVLALLPGQQRPALREGQPLRLEMVGYQYVYQNLTIDKLNDEVVGPQQVRRVLGSEIADSISVAGPVVVARAALQGETFVSAGEVYRFFDGMHARARVRTRSERLLTTLIPSIKVVTEQPQ